MCVLFAKIVFVAMLFAFCSQEFLLGFVSLHREGWAPARSLKQEKVKRYRKTVKTLRQRPWCMDDAADYLEKWLDGAAARAQGCDEVPPPCEFLHAYNDDPPPQVDGTSWSNFSAKPPKMLQAKEKALSRGGVVEGAEAEADRAMHPQLKTSYLISVLLAHSTCIANLCRFRASMGTVLRLMVDMASVASVAKSFTHTCTAWPARSWHVAHNPMSPARQCLPGRRRRRGRRAAAATR